MAHPEDQMIIGATVPTASGGVQSKIVNQTPKSGSEEKDPLIIPKIPSNLTAEAHLPASEATSSAKPEVVPKMASGQTMSTKSTALPASVPQTAPSTTPEARSLEGPKNVLKPPAEGVTPAMYQVSHSTDPEKVSTSTIPAPDGKGTPSSSNLGEEMDIEAGHHSGDSEKQKTGANQIEVDPNVVDWEGPDDPQNPINWSERLKWANVAIIASITFIT